MNLTLFVILKGGARQTGNIIKRLALTVYEGVQCREHGSLWPSVRRVLQLLGGQRGLRQAAGLQRGHGGAGRVVGAHVLLVASSAVLEPDLS